MSEPPGLSPWSALYSLPAQSQGFKYYLYDDDSQTAIFPSPEPQLQRYTTNCPPDISTRTCKHNLKCNVCQKNLLISILFPLSVAQAQNLNVTFDSSLSPATSHLSGNSVGSTGPSHRSLSRGCRQYPPKRFCFYPVCTVSPLST